MRAAQMALGYFDEALRHMLAWIGKAYPELQPPIGDVATRPTPLPNGVARHSANELVKFHFPYSNEECRHNREQRIWRASLPVIHLAVAVHVLGRHFNRGAKDFQFALDDPDLHQKVLALARVHEEAAIFERERRRAGGMGSSTFIIDPGILIRLSSRHVAA
jgi:hypothetical protein